MAPPQDTDVLLETVVIRPDQGAESSQIGNIQETSHPDSVKPERAMVSGQNPGRPGWHDQEMAD